MAKQSKMQNNTYRAKKSFGQNFLIDKHALQMIVSQCQESKTIIEIGAGLGALTTHLAQLQKPLWTIERDRDLIPLLQEKFKNQSHVHIIEDNALSVDYEAITSHPYYLVGNLPYNISAPLLMKIFTQTPSMKKAIVMVQREVAMRLLAQPNSKSRSSLSVWAQLKGTCKKVLTLSPAAFKPQPKVYSTIIAIESDPHSPLLTKDIALLEKILRTGFHQKRKKITNTLKPLLGSFTNEIIHQCQINPSHRAENVSLQQWIQLYDVVSTMKEQLGLQ